MSEYFPKLTPRFNELADNLNGQRVCVIGHARPDGDCIGSQLAATGMLTLMGIEAFAVNADRMPKPLGYLDGSDSIEIIDPQALDGIPIVYVDCADERRVGPKTSIALEKHRRIANIDHHISNTNFAEENLVDSGASATCEILAGIALDLDLEFDASIAQALYTGIVTDTGRFSYAATSSRVFAICSELVDRGASPQSAAEHLFENDTLPRLKLLERFLASLAFECDGKVCVGEIRQKDFVDTGTAYPDTEGFVDYARSVDGVLVGMLLEERKGTTKCSLRAQRSELRVDQVAAQFGGGGHACAAAVSSGLRLNELKRGLIEALAERVKEASSKA